MRIKRPDQKNAQSMIEAAESDLNFTLTITPTPESGATIIRNIYESFRLLGDALLVARGIESQDHVECIQELSEIPITTSRPIYLLNNLRRLRHNINYCGYRPTPAETEDVLSFARSCFNAVLKAVKKKIVYRPASL